MRLFKKENPTSGSWSKKELEVLRESRAFGEMPKTNLLETRTMAMDIRDKDARNDAERGMAIVIISLIDEIVDLRTSPRSDS